MNLRKALLICGLVLAVVSISWPSAQARRVRVGVGVGIGVGGVGVGIGVGVPVYRPYSPYYSPYYYRGYYPRPYRVNFAPAPAYYYPQPIPAAQPYYSNYPPSWAAPTLAPQQPQMTPMPETIPPPPQPAGTEF